MSSPTDSVASKPLGIGDMAPQGHTDAPELERVALYILYRLNSFRAEAQAKDAVQRVVEAIIEGTPHIKAAAIGSKEQ